MFIRSIIAIGGFLPIPTSSYTLKYISEPTRISCGTSCGTIRASTVLPWTDGIPVGISVSVTHPGGTTGDGTAGIILGDGITPLTGDTDIIRDGGMIHGIGIITGITVTGIRIIREDALIGGTPPNRISNRITRREHITRTIEMPEAIIPTPAVIVTLRTAETTTRVGDHAIKALPRLIQGTIAVIQEVTATPTERVPRQEAEATRARENIKKPDVENNLTKSII